MKSTRTQIRLLTICATMAACGTVSAHPWHGTDGGLGAGLAHPFLGLDHLLAMVAVGLWAAQLGGRWLWAIPLAFVTAMLAGGALGFTGFSLPFTEPFIAVSVLVLGLAVALRVRLQWMGIAIAAGFALFHGIAHAAELPAGAGAIAYAAGFATATAALHAAGIGLGIRMRSGRAFSRLAGTPIALAGCWLLVSSLV